MDAASCTCWQDQVAMLRALALECLQMDETNGKSANCCLSPVQNDMGALVLEHNRSFLREKVSFYHNFETTNLSQLTFDSLRDCNGMSTHPSSPLDSEKYDPFTEAHSDF